MRHPSRLALLTCLMPNKLAAAMPNLLLARQSCDSESWICPDWGGLWSVLEGDSQYLLPSSSQDNSGAQGPPISSDGQVYPGDRESGDREEPSKIPSTEPAIEVNVLSPSYRQSCDVSTESGVVSVSHFKQEIGFSSRNTKKKLSRIGFDCIIF